MPVRYYVCPITGTGQPGDGYRPAIPRVRDLPTTSRHHVMPQTPNGTPAQDWCLAMIDATDDVQSQIAALSGVREVTADEYATLAGGLA